MTWKYYDNTNPGMGSLDKNNLKTYRDDTNSLDSVSIALNESRDSILDTSNPIDESEIITMNTSVQFLTRFLLKKVFSHWSSCMNKIILNVEFWCMNKIPLTTLSLYLSFSLSLSKKFLPSNWWKSFFFWVHSNHQSLVEFVHEDFKNKNSKFTTKISRRRCL